jgi:hypothetical protein
MLDILIGLQAPSENGWFNLDIRVTNREETQTTISALPFTWARSHLVLFDSFQHWIPPDKNLPILNFGVYDTCPIVLASDETVCITVKLKVEPFKIQWLHSHVFTLTPGSYFLCVTGATFLSNYLKFHVSEAGAFEFKIPDSID